MKNQEKELYARWLARATDDPDLAAELRAMDEEKIADAFWRELDFGTAGLRGVIGAGTNRMNVYTVALASQGMADYLLSLPGEEKKIAVSYDSRIKSDLFARTASAVFAANGIRVFLYPRLMPVPCLSFAVRYLRCDAGVMVTASHNPSAYNGYKVYGPDGCQLTDDATAAVTENIRRHDIFDGVKKIPFAEGLADGRISYIGDDVYDAFRACVRSCSVLNPGDKADRGVAIVYSPLNGTGLGPVTQVLAEAGYTNVTVVEEQRLPDGNFPTCAYPNPENRDALALGLEYAERLGADLMIGTDPDCDRVGIAVRKPDGKYTLLTGNETGLLLLDYICERKRAGGRMPEDPLFVKTVVTADIAEAVAASYGVRCVNVLTGFKYIGEVITSLKAQGKEDAYLLGFEESYGYLSGTHVRDKDGVNAAFLICEMFSYYRAQGKGLYERLRELYAAFGYCLNNTRSYVFEGAEGFAAMQRIMTSLRGGMEKIGPARIVRTTDYLPGTDGLPKADVIKYRLDDGSSVTVRPSGTEPKLKVYFSISAATEEEARARLAAYTAAMEERIR